MTEHGIFRPQSLTTRLGKKKDHEVLDGENNSVTDKNHMKNTWKKNPNKLVLMIYHSKYILSQINMYLCYVELHEIWKSTHT